MSEQIEKAFTYHPPKDGQPEKYTMLRQAFKEVANLVDGHVPDGREKSLALTKLEESIMWANAGIARNE
ncbi:hypothetical protein LJB76_02785 [Clostridia bacterium OttesenSCG-928-O13]|nr:hypothetical protein [Clostridia bacterium OttesenSCG-928-O13]